MMYLTESKMQRLFNYFASEHNVILIGEDFRTIEDILFDDRINLQLTEKEIELDKLANKISEMSDNEFAENCAKLAEKFNRK